MRQKGAEQEEEGEEEKEEEEEEEEKEECQVTGPGGWGHAGV